MNYYKREDYLQRIRPFLQDTQLIKVLCGVRRCGKSSIMHMLVDELINDYHIKKQNIIFLNLDSKDYYLVNKVQQLQKIIDDLTLNIKGTKYLFIDEIQNVKNFELLINAYRESNEFSIFITGSNAYLLSGMLSTKLTGRYIEFEIFPLSFEEYLQMKQWANIPLKDLNSELDAYILHGGFPLSVTFNNPIQTTTYTTNIIDEIFKKDIYQNIRIDKRHLLDLILKYMINNYGCVTSVINITKQLQNNGYKIKQETVGKYLQVLVNAKILYECSRFDLKSKKMLKGEKKYYLVDLSFTNFTNPNKTINYGLALENIVFIYAKSKNYEISIGKIGNLECDFILKDIFNQYAYLQVCYLLNDQETIKREFNPLLNIKDNWPKYVTNVLSSFKEQDGIKVINILLFMQKGLKFNDETFIKEFYSN